MNKVICDICGTSYPSNAKKCPICGSAREYALEEGGQEEELEFRNEPRQTAPAGRRNREIFDYNEVNQVRSSAKTVVADEDYDDEEEYEEESRSNVGLVIVLVILIVLLLLTAGFFFLKYLLPNMTASESTLPPTTEAVQTEPVETTEPTIPCTNLMLDGGKMELTAQGFNKLLNVHVYPENTTDKLVYVSGDESIVTVSESGTVTAVGEGQTVITITCGKQQINCNVIVDYSLGEETVPTETIPAATVEETTVPTVPTETATEAATVPGEPKLKLKQSSTDITIGFNRASVTLEMDCDIDPKDVNWFTMDSLICIIHDGVVTATGSGITKVYGEYGGEQVMCIVRCIF